MKKRDVNEGNQNLFQALTDAHEAYKQAKKAYFTGITKTTTGKMNLTKEDIDACRKWLAFDLENEDYIPKKFDLNDFSNKIELFDAMQQVKAWEEKAYEADKALYDIIASDLRYYWSTSEDFYKTAAGENPTIKEKYKNLPTVGSTRKSNATKENGKTNTVSTKPETVVVNNN
jgi:hypothetical protein